MGMEQGRSPVPRAGRLAAAFVVGILVIAGGLAGSAYAAPGGDDGGRGGGQRDVIANLFEWNWPSVADECVHVLGPAGYGGVQVAPPQDSLRRTPPPEGTPVLHPWWEVYQPVDYNLTSRMGNEAQFRSMVSTCRAAGVKVYADVVINHMTGQGSVSYGGVHYTHFSYPGVYDSADFHHAPADCPTAGGIDDFNNYLQVTRCELLGLADLRTESDHVRATLAGYLNKLIGYGVSGFRVDAAKHIGQPDLAGIEARLHSTLDGTRPFVALEVFPGGPGKLAPQAFTGVGTMLGFDFAYQVHDAFKSYPANATGNITDLAVFGEASGLLPSDKSLVFVENHDTERGNQTLSYKDGATNILATEFMLARGYGTPQVYSSFTFTGNDDSPPADANGFVTNTVCGAGWTCLDRVTGVANMVGWHNVVGGAPLANWYDDGVNLIAFSRGARGWIALNNHASAQTRTFGTGLRPGTYCDIIHGTAHNGSCSGPTVTVDSHHNATVTVPGKDAVAIDTASLVRAHD
jgi:alpha-amylase